MRRPGRAPANEKPPLSPRDLVVGKYRVERAIGGGGMGLVFVAQHEALRSRVAIKCLHPHLADSDETVARFAREARAAATLESDHVVRIFDVGELESGVPFIIMEHLDGADLSAVRRNQRPLPVPVAVAYVLDACEAIAEAHRKGIIHRDLKPANLFVARRGDGRSRIKVLDFGISKELHVTAGSGLTETAAVIGSAEYMSPEQMRSLKDVDAGTDIWALGVTLYELLTARVPFEGQTATQICALVMTTTPRRPSELRDEIPSGVDDIVMRCLERERERRFATVEELAAALRPWAGDGIAPNASPTSPIEPLATVEVERVHEGDATPAAPPAATDGPGEPSRHEPGEPASTTTGALASASLPASSRFGRGSIATVLAAILIVGGALSVVAVTGTSATKPTLNLTTSGAVDRATSDKPHPAFAPEASEQEAAAAEPPAASTEASAAVAGAPPPSIARTLPTLRSASPPKPAVTNAPCQPFKVIDGIEYHIKCP